jgi:hypothetical protein
MLHATACRGGAYPYSSPASPREAGAMEAPVLCWDSSPDTSTYDTIQGHLATFLFFSQLGLIALVWLCVMLHGAWPSDSAAVCSTTPEPTPPVPKRHRVPKPFTGLTIKPHCDACEHGSDLRPEAPHTPPPRIVPPRGRRRQVDTSTHFCPNPACAYRGWVGWGNLRANGHPNGGPWRQLLCVVCRGYFPHSNGFSGSPRGLGCREQLAP